MADRLKLTLVTPEKELLTEEPVDEVFVPGHAGELNILPQHIPLVTTLGIGKLKYRLADQTMIHTVAVSWGYCEVGANGAVNVLAEIAETPEEIDLGVVKEAKDTATSKLSGAEELTGDEFDKYSAQLERAYLREEVAGLTSKSN